MKLCRNDDAGIAGVRPEERRADRLGEAETDRAADQRAEQVGDLGVAQPGFDADDDQAEQRADSDVQPTASGVNGRTQHCRVGDREHEQAHGRSDARAWMSSAMNRDAEIRDRDSAGLVMTRARTECCAYQSIN